MGVQGVPPVKTSLLTIGVNFRDAALFVNKFIRS